MKIQISPFSKTWKAQFELIKSEIESVLFNKEVKIEHIGSTSVENLSAKPIIDIMVGVNSNEELDLVVNPLLKLDYIYYEKYNSIMPNRRFFIKLINQEDKKLFQSVYSNNDNLPHEEINNLRLAQIHVWKYNSEDWIRHIAVRDYLRNNEVIKAKYQAVKLDLAKLEWRNGTDYNNGKNEFMTELEKKALKHYKNI